MNIVVVGGGLAGARAVEELRALGHPGDITLFAAEEHVPYERPPLSKDLLAGKAGVGDVLVHDGSWYDDHEVDLRTGTRVEEIDLDRCHVLAGGREMPYDRLLLATGSRPRLLPGNPAGVRYLRTLDDAVELRDRLRGDVVVIGAGWIGLEVAAAARQAGASVTVVEPGPLPLAQVLGPEVAPIFAELHRRHGVDLRLGVSVESVRQGPPGASVTLSDGATLGADLVVAGIGVQPDDALAARAGLGTDDGVLVDAWLRTSDPHVYAAGDVANHDHPLLGRLRVEHWDTAAHHGRHAARVMLGADEPYERLPYFFTDQYDVGMEYVGHVGPDGYDEVVVRGDLASGGLTALWIRRDMVSAGMHLNDWDAIEPLRAMVGRRLDPRLRDPAFPLADAG